VEEAWHHSIIHPFPVYDRRRSAARRQLHHHYPDGSVRVEGLVEQLSFRALPFKLVGGFASSRVPTGYW